MQATNQTTHTTIVSPLFLFGTTILTLIGIGAILYKLSGLAYHEQPVRLAPVPAAELVHPVKVGLTIASFDSFDVNHEKFELNGIVSFEFAEKAVSPEQLSSVVFARAKELYRSAPLVVTEQGRTKVYYHVRVRAFEDLDFAWFPFEDHQLSLLLIDRTAHGKKKYALVTDDAALQAPDMTVRGWHKFAEHARAGMLEERVQGTTLSYPAALFTIEYGRSTNVRNIFMILLPMLLLFFIALFSLIIDPRDNFTFVLTIPVSSIVGLISFRFVMEAMSPSVGYFMYSDYFFMLFLCLVFGILIFHTFGYQIGAFVRKCLILACDVVVLLFFYLLVHHIDAVFTAMRAA